MGLCACHPLMGFLVVQVAHSFAYTRGCVEGPPSVLADAETGNAAGMGASECRFVGLWGDSCNMYPQGVGPVHDWVLVASLGLFGSSMAGNDSHP